MSKRTRPCFVRRLVALDIDGTLVDHDGRASGDTVAALALVRAAGHEVVPATGRSLVGMAAAATRLGLTDAFAVCSNGALTVRLDASAPSGYLIQHAHRFDTSHVVRLARDLVPGVRIAAEDVGWGWRVSEPFGPDLLNGEQKQVPLIDLRAARSTRIALHAPGIRRRAGALAASGATVIAGGPDWLDVTAPGTGKAPALERLRTALGVPHEATVAVGDGPNDLEMLTWAHRGVAMGHASAEVRAAADEITGTIDEHGAASVLLGLLPAGAPVDVLSPLAAQLSVAVSSAHAPMSVRVWHGRHTEVARCDTWVLHEGFWRRHGPVPAGAGATMRSIERSAREAGLAYPRGTVGRRRAHWRSVQDGTGRNGFELPLLPPP